MIEKHEDPTPSYRLEDIHDQYNLDMMNFQQGSPSKMINVNVGEQNEVNEAVEYDPDSLFQQADQEVAGKEENNSKMNASQTS